MTSQQNIATVMRAIKEKRGKSLAEFASELDVSRSAMQEYLSGKGNPNLTTIDHLAEKLGVDSSFLISGAYSQDQIQILLQLLDMLQLLSALPPDKRRQFAELLLEMISLWDSQEENP